MGGWSGGKVKGGASSGGGETLVGIKKPTTLAKSKNKAIYQNKSEKIFSMPFA